MLTAGGSATGFAGASTRWRRGQRTTLVQQTFSGKGALLHERNPARGERVMTGSGGDSPDVFVSYCRDDRASVEVIVRALEAEGRTVWWDARLEAGDTFDAEIARTLRAARCVLVCWTNRSIASEWVRAEALDGRNRAVLIGCMLEPCEPIPPFNILHHEDLSRWRGDRTDECWRRLSQVIAERCRHIIHRRRSPIAQRPRRFAHMSWLIAVAALAIASVAAFPRAPDRHNSPADAGQSSVAHSEELTELSAAMETANVGAEPTAGAAPADETALEWAELDSATPAADVRSDEGEDSAERVPSDEAHTLEAGLAFSDDISELGEVVEPLIAQVDE